MTPDVIRSAGRPISLWIVPLIVLIGLSLGALIPPFQSPDEFDHLKRAYLLTRGHILLETPAGQSSGGRIDTGMLAYIAAYDPVSHGFEHKLSTEEIRTAEAIRWSSQRVFSGAPGTGFYFPLIYLPQAVGLALGEVLHQPVAVSYQLARLVALFADAGLLLAAFRLFPVNPLALALLLIPMSLFQFASTGLDGVATALSVFALAAFCRLSLGLAGDRRLFLLLAGAVFLLIGSRLHLLPMLALLAFAAGRDRRRLLIAGLTAVAVFAWLGTAIATNVDARMGTGVQPVTVALYYLARPLSFFRLLGDTLGNEAIALFYRDSFFGILGYLDSHFGPKTYRAMTTLTLAIAVLSMSWRQLRRDWAPRGLLVAGALVSSILVFCALLLTWNPHPAKLIQGVQGRYFLIPALMLAYGLAGGIAPARSWPRRLALVLVVGLAYFSLTGTSRLLLERYYLAPRPPAASSTAG